MDFFLKLKAWQVFILILLPMVLAFVVFPGTEIFKWLEIITLFSMLVFFGWLYSVGSEANKRLPTDLRKNLTIYQLGLVVPIFYVFLIFLFIPFDPMSKSMPVWFVPLHLASMFGIFYGLWFTAKQFVTLQKRESAKFIEYSGYFFLFWFCFIGVWFLQPRINEVFYPKNINKN